MIGRARGALALCLLAPAATLLALWAILAAPRPWQADIGAPGDAYMIADSYPAEDGAEGTSLRWSRARSQLGLPGAYLGSAVLAVRLYRQGDAATPWALQLAAAGAAPAPFDAAPGWRVYRVLLPPGAAAQPLALSGPTFQPGPGDPRSLGVAIDWLRVVPLARAGDAAAPALGRALWLALAIALAGAAAWLLDSWARGAAAAAGRPWRLAALLAGLGLAASAWAWAEPVSLAWLLPTSWPTLAWLGLGLLPLGAATALAPRLAALRWPPAALRGLPAAVAAGLALAHLVALAPLPADWRGAAAWAILGAPGALAALAIFRAEPDLLERALLALAGAIGVAAALVLALHALPGPLSAALAIAAADGLSLLGGLALLRPAGRSGPQEPPAPPRADRWLIAPLLIAAGLRLPLLGAAELQGDEAYVLMLARGIRYGQPDILFVHMKGPVEALLPAGPLAITGVASEWAARLPFAVAGLGLLLGVWLLAGRLIGGPAGDRAGLLAASAMAVDGFLIAFSRIVQYQSVILLLSLTAIWLCWRFYEGAARPRPYLLGAAFCAGVAMLAHYDGALATPAMAWLVLAGGRRRGWSPRQWLAELAAPLGLGLLLTLSFYLPFALHEHFRRTVGHLATRSGQGGAGPALFNNLQGYAELAGFYSFPAAVVAAGLALLGGLAGWLAIYVRPRALGLAMAALLLAGGLAAALAPGVFAAGPDRSLAAIALAPPLLALALAPRLPAGMRALAIWFGVPFVAMAFFLADPRTHFYTMHLPALILAGLAAGQLYALLGRQPLLRIGLAAAAAALLLAALPYAELVFLRQRPEYQRDYPATRAAIARPLTGDTLADDGYFGMPQQDGWKAVGELYRRGELRGSVDSNQELFTSGWYLRGQFMCAVDPDHYIVSEHTRPYYIPPGYQEYGAVTVGGLRTLTIFSRAPVAGPPRLFAAEDYAASFDAAPVPDFPLRRLLSGVVPQRPAPGASWRAGFGLRGYDLDRAALGPDDVAYLTLYWRAERPLAAGRRPLVELRDAAGGTVAAAGVCGGMPSDAWFQNYVNDTPYQIRADRLAAGVYTVVVSVGDGAGGRLPLAGGGESWELGQITVGGR